MLEAEDDIRTLFSAASGEWEIVELQRGLASLLLRIRASGPPDRDVSLWITPRNDLEPAFGRTKYFNIALRGEEYSGAECDLAAVVIEKVSAQETDRPAIDFSMPPVQGRHSLVLNVSNRCNLKCRFCFEDESKRAAPAPTVEEIRRTFENDDPPQVRNVMFMSGETVLRKDALALVRMAREMGYRNIGLATNGTYFTSKGRLEPFLQAGLRGLEISIHSMNPEHASYLSGRAFTPVKQRQCLEVIDALDGEYPLHCTINTVVNSVNVGDFLDLVSIIEHDFPRIRPTYHVKYTEAIEKIRDRVKIAGWPEIRKAGIIPGLPGELHPRINFENFPLCVISPCYHLSSNLISFLVSDAYSFFNPGDEENLVTADAFRSRQTHFAEECGECSLIVLCCGMSAAYLELFGHLGHCIPQSADPLRVLGQAIEFRRNNELDYSSEIEQGIEKALSHLRLILSTRDHHDRV
ncbi:MAG TPA: radical SAM protein [Myxococcota bacterium]|nr:radical SAM protein [Myxococcota bacterium]